MLHSNLSKVTVQYDLHKPNSYGQLQTKNRKNQTFFYFFMPSTWNTVNIVLSQISEKTKFKRLINNNLRTR